MNISKLNSEVNWQARFCIAKINELQNKGLDREATSLSNKLIKMLDSVQDLSNKYNELISQGLLDE